MPRPIMVDDGDHEHDYTVLVLATQAHEKDVIYQRTEILRCKVEGCKEEQRLVQTHDIAAEGKGPPSWWEAQ